MMFMFFKTHEQDIIHCTCQDVRKKKDKEKMKRIEHFESQFMESKI